MKLPKKISPNPLLITTVEIRFKSESTFQDIFKVASGIVSKGELTNLIQNPITNDLVIPGIELNLVPNFIINNDQFKVSFGNSILSFEVIGEYPFWSDYSKFIKKYTKLILPKLKVKIIKRIGVRYGSIFNKTVNANTILNDIPTFNLDGYKGKLEYFSYTINEKETQLLLQVYDNAKAKKGEIDISGVYLDIDASNSNEFDFEEDIEEVYKRIYKLHEDEKLLFFKLLKEEFLKTLNPEY